VHCGISAGVLAQSTDSRKETFAIGAWGGFFDGLRACRYNAEPAKSSMKRGKTASSSGDAVYISMDRSGSSRSDSDDRIGRRSGLGVKRTRCRSRSRTMKGWMVETKVMVREKVKTAALAARE
jgi:hypothetical protein